MSFEQVPDYALFSLLGVLGAIFANSTGAGGGVIFIPAFNELNFTEMQAIGTSFAIQCFGMTAGGLTWWYHYKTEKRELRLWQGFKRILAITSIASIFGLWGRIRCCRSYANESTPKFQLVFTITRRVYYHLGLFH